MSHSRRPIRIRKNKKKNYKALDEVKSGSGSSVGIATDYVLDGPGVESRLGRDFPPVQTGPGTHPASCTMGTGSFPVVKSDPGVTLLVRRPRKS